MADDLVISSEPEASPADLAKVRRGLEGFNAGQTGLPPPSPLNVLARDGAGEIQGGLLGELWGGWLHVRVLWVAAAFRGQRLGQRLLAAAEHEAADRGAQGCFLSTFDFEAPGFYQRLGYEVYGELPGHPPGHTKYHLRKWLVRL